MKKTKTICNNCERGITVKRNTPECPKCSAHFSQDYIDSLFLESNSNNVLANKFKKIFNTLINCSVIVLIVFLFQDLAFIAIEPSDNIIVTKKSYPLTGVNKKLVSNHLERISNYDDSWLTYEIKSELVLATINQNTEKGQYAVSVIKKAKETGDYSIWKQLAQDVFDAECRQIYRNTGYAVHFIVEDFEINPATGSYDALYDVFVFPDISNFSSSATTLDNIKLNTQTRDWLTPSTLE